MVESVGIPKIIHYCWFGRGEYPETVRECITSWQKHLPGYEFVLWNEDNFDVNMSVWTKQAYEAKKYAFVADYVRCYALVNQGGVYMDTDVEVLKDFSQKLNNKIVLSAEELDLTGAFMASEKGVGFFAKALEVYNGKQFVKPDGSLDIAPNNVMLIDILKEYGYVKEDKLQLLQGGITVYPSVYFHAKSLMTGKIYATDETFCIHHHTLLWVSNKTKIIKFIRQNILIPVFGKKNYKRILNFIGRH